ncbi:MAG: lytic transglycosylase [Pseudomonas sp. PGPPP3]|nr:MAG: lytic transglycosylase [Pseudomonas sp. PGPPP3]
MSSSTRKTSELETLVRNWRPLLLVAAMTLGGCQVHDTRDTDADADNARNAARQHAADWTPAPQPQRPDDVWERIREGFQLQGEIGVNPRIERQRLWYASRPAVIESAGKRSSPYLHFVVERLDERDMPMELALLPIIESSYNPLAYSRSHAAGLWQFIPSTGRNFNLRQTNWYDGRRDIMASTNAAMNYLTRLHDMFNGDWLLALAAYNAGEGTVSRAIERNQKLGLPTDYWNLPLPKETQEYVPKLLDRSSIAEMAEVDEDELFQLNPAFKKGVTIDGPQHLLVPSEKAERLAANLLLMKPQKQVQWQQYTVRKGDSLASIAKRHNLSVKDITDLNQLRHHKLRTGQVLSLSTQVQSASSNPLYKESSPVVSAPAKRYKVKSGDNLWSIAKQQKVAVKDLQSWNQLRDNNLKLGQELLLQAPKNQAAVLASKSLSGKNSKTITTKPSDREAVTYYKVQKGDSLYLIAKRFKVDVAQLQRWNPKATSALKLGQTLTVKKAP